MPNMTNYRPEDITPTIRKYLGMPEVAEDYGTSEGAIKAAQTRKAHGEGGTSYEDLKNWESYTAKRWANEGVNRNAKEYDQHTAESKFWREKNLEAQGNFNAHPQRKKELEEMFKDYPRYDFDDYELGKIKSDDDY